MKRRGVGRACWHRVVSKVDRGCTGEHEEVWLVQVQMQADKACNVETPPLLQSSANTGGYCLQGGGANPNHVGGRLERKNMHGLTKSYSSKAQPKEPLVA